MLVHTQRHLPTKNKRNKIKIVTGPNINLIKIMYTLLF